MNKKAVIIVIIFAVVLGIYYFVSKNSPADTTPTLDNQETNNDTTPAPATSSSKTSTTPKVTSVAVSLKNLAFYPSVSNIKIGTKVRWTNKDVVNHTIVSDSGTFNSGTLSPGQSFSFTFNKLGSVNYHCTIHPAMKGLIIIHK